MWALEQIYIIWQYLQIYAVNRHQKLSDVIRYLLLILFMQLVYSMILLLFFESEN